MVKIKTGGFISNIYVFLNSAISFSISFFIYLLLLFESNCQFVTDTAIFFSLFAVVFFLNYLHAPFAYKRFFIDSKGIRCGKKYIKYSDIKTVSVSRGYISEYYGFSFLEDLTGISQKDEIFVEDMICINCDFSGFKLKNTRNCIYVPKNESTEKLLNNYCEAYLSLSSQASNIAAYSKVKPEFSMLRLIASLLLSLILSVAICFIVTNDSSDFYKPLLIIPFMLLWVILSGFKAHISAFLYRKFYTQNKH